MAAIGQSTIMNPRQDPRRQQQEAQSKSLSAPPPQKAPGASLSQSIAFLLVYKRLVRTSLLGPLALLGIPVIIFVLDLLTFGNGFGMIVLTAGYYQFIVFLFLQLTPKTPTVNALLTKLRARHYLQAFACASLTVYVVRTYLPFVEFTWSPPLMPFVTAALTAMVLAATVVVRYVGPHCLMRCSTMPLVSHPWESWFREMRRRFLTVVSPGETTPMAFSMGASSTTTTTSTQEQSSSYPSAVQRRPCPGRRYLHPSALSLLVQAVVAFCAGSLVAMLWASYCVGPAVSSEDSSYYHYDEHNGQYYYYHDQTKEEDASRLLTHRFVFYVGCAVSAALPLLPFLRGEAHEINPTLYALNHKATTHHSHENAQSLYMTHIQSLVIHSIANTLVATVTALVIVAWAYPGHSLPGILVNIQFMICWGIMSSILVALDEILKWILVGLESDFDEPSVSVTVQCLLGEPMIVDKLLQVSTSVSFTNGSPYPLPGASLDSLEHEELKLYESCISDMAKRMTNPVDHYPEAPLEEDLLKYSVLQSIGGANTSPQQRAKLLQYMKQSDASSSMEPTQHVKFLVRGLCVFMGGVAESIQRTLKDTKFRPHASERWVIPFGAATNVLCAVRAVGRCFRMQTSPIPLSVTQPAVLATLFLVRTMIGKTHAASKSPTYNKKVTFSSGIEQVLQDIVDECDAVGAVLTQSLTSEVHMRMQHMHFTDEMMVWVRQLLEDNNSKTPMLKLE